MAALALTLLLIAPGPQTSGQEPLRVFAAASLVDAVRALEPGWRATGGAPLAVSPDASSRLATQIARGAPVDVFLSADPVWMDWLIGEGAVDPAAVRPFAGNRLVVAARPGTFPPMTNSTELVEELRTSDGRLALAAEPVPAGRYARAALEADGLWDALEPRIVRGGSVRSVVEWAARGEVAAAVVYETDVLGDPRLETVLHISSPSGAPVVYVAAALGAPEGRPEAFLDFITSARAGETLAELGFLPPPVRPVQSPPPAEPAVPGAGRAILLSLLVATCATALAAVPAVLCGWLLARREFTGKVLVSTALLAPLVLPPVVTGYLLLAVFGREGPVGSALASLGISVSFTMVGAVLAAAVVGFPLFVLASRAAFEGVDRRYEDVALSLGLTPGRAFRRVALPLARSGILAGAVLTFARALGEFGATIVLAGNLDGATRTIPLAVYTLLESPGGQRGVALLVLASLLLSLGALVGYELLLRRGRTRA